MVKQLLVIWVNQEQPSGYLFVENGVAVLFNETFTLVLDAVSEMSNNESRIGEARLGELGVLLTLVIELLDPCVVGTTRYSTLLVKQVKHT